MKASTRKLEIQFNRLKNKKAKQGVRLFYSMFKKMYSEYLKAALMLPPEQWISATDNIKEDQVKKAFEKYYPMFAENGVMMKNHLMNQKADEDVVFENLFADKLKNIATTEAGTRIVSITNTTKAEIEKVVQSVISTAMEEGIGVEETAKLLKKKIGDNLIGNAMARARAIAQTEMISASNQASMFAAQSTGLETRKFWSTSGLGGVRTSHSADQDFSDKVGGLKDDEVFPNTGLRYPGDPSGAAKEVINCRCTLLHEVV